MTGRHLTNPVIGHYGHGDELPARIVGVYLTRVAGTTVGFLRMSCRAPLQKPWGRGKQPDGRVAGPCGAEDWHEEPLPPARVFWQRIRVGVRKRLHGHPGDAHARS
ncbi:hypothetical protein GbCGDNIH4_7287 [Granulibacter bethesdensis CGDNIH4]|nr:hypothetical protein GbCGDNIH4_7287 [Granulibacter bethesdensis CGDNIH4]